MTSSASTSPSPPSPTQLTATSPSPTPSTHSSPSPKQQQQRPTKPSKDLATRSSIKKNPSTSQPPLHHLLKHCCKLLSLHHEFYTSSDTPDLISQSLKADNSIDTIKQPALPLKKSLSNYFAENGVTDERDRVFLEEVVTGVVRYKGLIEVTLKLFYEKTGARYLRRDFFLFATLVYLSLFRLHELTFPVYARLIRTCDPTKMARLVGFIFDSNHITPPNPEKGETDRACLLNAWSNLLDKKFVEDVIVVKLLGIAKEARELLDGLVEVSKCGMPEPFLLTRPNPRKVPEPTYSHSTLTKARPIPKTFYTGTGELKNLAETKILTRKKQSESQQAASTHLFRVATLPPKPVIASTSPSVPAPPRKPKPLPEFKEVEVKWTAAAILREDALVRKKRKEELKVVKEVEMSLHDATEFRVWQEELKAKSDTAHLQSLTRRRLEIQLLHEEAVEAKQLSILANQALVTTLKEEAALLKETAEEKKREMEEENKKKIEDVREGMEAVTKAKMRVVEGNQRKAADIALENLLLKEKAHRQAEEERLRKSELIHQIRLLEKSIVPVGSYIKTIDVTETSGMGLLGEMSILELCLKVLGKDISGDGSGALQERLALTKAHHAHLSSQKRNTILTEKSQRAAQIQHKLESLSKELKVVVDVDQGVLKGLREKIEGKKAGRVRSVGVIGVKGKTRRVKSGETDRWKDLEEGLKGKSRVEAAVPAAIV
ncbi:hypothetical protein BC829DRAFT_448998 [Chytridium lagenaria]|nr:hypothetical protein BC829DRAFT_448998 [Chytridium lagenaria]